MNLFRVMLLMVAMLAAGSAVRAEDVVAGPKLTPHQMRDDTLDSLFAKLQRPASEDEAKQTESKIWQAWSQSDSVTADTLLNQAAIAMQLGENKASLTIIDQVLALYPTFAEAWNKRATLEFSMGRYNDSLADIEKVLELEPRHFGALSGRGMIYQAQGKWGEALSAFRSALVINPNMTGVKNAIREIEKIQPEL